MNFSDPKYQKGLTTLLGLVLLVVIGLAISLFWSAPPNSTPSSAAEYFATQAKQQTAGKLGGQPIEGFQPVMLMLAFPGLVATDFEHAQAVGGYYTIQNGQVSLVFSEGNVNSSADEALTDAGFTQILTNLGTRLNLPIASRSDVDRILGQISTAP